MVGGFLLNFASLNFNKASKQNFFRLDYQFCQGDRRHCLQKCSPHTQNMQNTNRNKLVTTTKTNKLQHNKKQIKTTSLAIELQLANRTICRLHIYN